MQYVQNLTIKQWADEDRPREKLIIKGKAALTDAELIAILIGSGTRETSAVELAKAILARYGNDLNQLAKLSLNELKKFNGIGEAKAISIISALELGRRRKESKPEKKILVRSAAQTYDFLKPYMLDLDHEEFWVIFLNRRNEVIKCELVSSGGVNGTVADQKLIFKKALELLASNIIVAHNHPSGSLEPSQQDIHLTKKIKEAGRLLDIPLLDHLIFTDAGYYSFADKSML